jgi:hypothetical protein
MRTWGCLLAGVLLAACSGGGGSSASGPDPGSSARSTVAVASSSTTVRKPDHKLYSFDPNPNPPPIINTGADYVAIARSLLDFQDWAFSHDPDPALVRKFAGRGSNVESSATHDLTALRDNNKRYYQLTDGPGRLWIISLRPDAVSLRADQEVHREIVVNRSGRITSQNKLPGYTKYLVVLGREGTRWYLLSVVQTSP